MTSSSQLRSRRLPPGRRSVRDYGSTTLELVVLTPALIVFLMLAIAAGRITLAHATVEAAARDAARQASISRDPATARANAVASAQAALTREGLSCPAEVTVDTQGFMRPVGQAATVTAHVTCTVQLADVSIVGVPATTITKSFRSPIDPFRGRSLGRTNHQAGATR